MPSYFLGIDIGNTKSNALICDENGQAIGASFAGPGNHERLGKNGFYAVLDQLVTEAIEKARISLDRISAAGFGIAGYDWPEDLPLMQEVIARVGIDVPYNLMNDSGIGFFAGSQVGWGVSVSSGTSANARGWDAEGRSARMTGNGLRFGEYGGGQELVYRSIQSISRDWSRRGPPTLLSDIFVEFFGAKNLDDLVSGIARGRYHFSADQALLVFQAAEEGDAVAKKNIQWLAFGLADLACGIIRQLDFEDLTFDIVLSGSIYMGSPVIKESMKPIIHSVAPGGRFIHLKAPPVTGAVMLAMKQVEVEYLKLQAQIIKTGSQLLAS